MSPFEIILSDVRRGISNDACNRMKSMYTSDPRRNMTNAVWVITTYIELKNGLCQIRFEIKNGNPSE